MTASQIKFKARILHVLSQFEVTGAETYAATLADAQVEQGHEVFIVSDTFSTPTKANYTRQSIGRRGWSDRLRNILFLRRFIKQNKIDFVHAHSRAASWVSYYATKNPRVPLVSTIHGRQHIHRSSKGKDIYGERIIAVCDNIKQHLVTELHLAGAKIKVIPNALKFHAGDSYSGAAGGLGSVVSPEMLKSHQVISIIGRSTGPKGEKAAQLVAMVVPRVLEKYPNSIVQIVGGDWEKFSAADRAKMADAKSRYSGRLIFKGFSKNLEDLIQGSSVVIASGRVAIESLWLKVPLIAMGESKTLGLVSLDNVDAALASNFGDCSSSATDAEREVVITEVMSGIETVLAGETANRAVELANLSRRVESFFGYEAVLSQIEEIYLQARMIKASAGHIPNLMYHKIPDQPLESKHRIFVTKDLFAKQMALLRKAGFQALTFKDYDEYRSGLRPISNFPKKPIFITFDDGYVDNLTNALPILRKNGFKCTLFCLGDSSVDHNKWDAGDVRSPIMSLKQKRQLLEAGVEIGAHSMSHRDMTKLNEAEALYELEASKAALEEQLDFVARNEQVIVYAYPYGYCNEQVKGLASKAGYRYAVATDTGGLHLEDDRMQIFRVNIFPEDSGFRFWKKIQPWYRAYYFRKRGH